LSPTIACFYTVFLKSCVIHKRKCIIYNNNTFLLAFLGIEKLHRFQIKAMFFLDIISKSRLSPVLSRSHGGCYKSEAKHIVSKVEIVVSG
jgi:hypothetical protein